VAGFESTIKEIEAQQTDLLSFASELNSINISQIDPGASIFVGAGDSLACAMFVERLSNLRPRSMDPYEIYNIPEIARGKDVHFISVSGRTKSNVEAASTIEGIARNTVAITANPDSPLALNCSKVLEIKFTKAPGITPGTNSFTTSLLPCCRLFNKIPEISDLTGIFTRAKRWAESQSENADAVHFVSTGFLYPIAMYGSAKVFEFTGQRSDYQLTEEFSHLNLFCLRKEDLVVILRDGDKDLVATRLAHELNHEGYCAQVLEFKEPGMSSLEVAISGAIHMQYFALNMALRNGLEQPAFLSNQNLLQISNKMIYLG